MSSKTFRIYPNGYKILIHACGLEEYGEATSSRFACGSTLQKCEKKGRRELMVASALAFGETRTQIFTNLHGWVGARMSDLSLPLKPSAKHGELRGTETRRGFRCVVMIACTILRASVLRVRRKQRV